MNKNYVNEKTYLLQFRLRTARRKKRAQHEDRNKQLLALNREKNALNKQQYNLGWMDLYPPVVRGWKRYFVLRSDVAKSKQAAFFESILQKINTTQYSHRKDFKIKKRKEGKKVYAATAQNLLQFDEYYFNKNKFSVAEKTFFDEVWIQHKWSKKPCKVFVFTEPYRFVLRVRPNIITKTRIRNEAIEKRVAEIHNYFERNNLWGKLYHLTDGYRYSYRKGEKEKEKNPLRNKSFTSIVTENFSKELYDY